MTTQTSTNPAVAFIREGAQLGHWYLDGTMADVTSEQAHYAPPGRANPIGATFAHLVCSEDLIVNGMLRQQAPLSASSHAGRTGLSEPMPMPGSPDWGEAYGAWARRVRVDLATLKSYAEAVYGSTDAYLASLSDSDLDRELDLTAVGFGQQKLAWMLNLLVLNHIGTETGEISTLKGIQGAKGYPF
jgi:DinB family protein